MKNASVKISNAKLDYLTTAYEFVKCGGKGRYGLGRVNSALARTRSSLVRDGLLRANGGNHWCPTQKGLEALFYGGVPIDTQDMVACQ